MVKRSTAMLSRGTRLQWLREAFSTMEEEDGGTRGLVPPYANYVRGGAKRVTDREKSGGSKVPLDKGDLGGSERGWMVGE